MCQLSGEVYLAADVERELAERERAHQREVAEFQARILKLTRKTMGFRKGKPRARGPAGVGVIDLAGSSSDSATEHTNKR